MLIVFELLCLQIMEYYFEERLHILQCVKFLLSYWQDPRHPYRVRKTADFLWLCTFHI